MQKSIESARTELDRSCRALRTAGGDTSCAEGLLIDLVGWQDVCTGQARRYLHAYDYQILDDIYVFVDETGRVCDKVFWAD